MTKKDKLCLAPWNLIRIEEDGNCYSCSSAFVKQNYTLGNIFSDSIEEIWNGEKAKKYRADKLGKEYKYCKRGECNLFCGDFKQYKIRNYNITTYSPYPSFVSLSYDYTCSQRCIFCRDEYKALQNVEIMRWETILEEKIIPLLQNAEILEITCAGELFDSKHSIKILKRIIEVYPHIKLRIFSNGINFTEENIKKLKIKENIEEVCISLHSASEKTYKNIFRTNNFSKVIKNLEYLQSLKKEGFITALNIQFAINIFNYREIKKFINLCITYDATPTFLMTNNITNTNFVKNKEYYAVYDKNHHLYNSFIQTINNSTIQKYIPYHLKTLRKNSIIQTLNNYYHYIKLKIKREI